MAVVIVVGAQWGDEGKGKVVDLFTERADVVVRYGGGANAGHTLVDRRPEAGHAPRAVGRAAIRGKQLRARRRHGDRSAGAARRDRAVPGARPARARRAARSACGAHVILPYHKLIDGLREDRGAKTAARSAPPGAASARRTKRRRRAAACACSGRWSRKKNQYPNPAAYARIFCWFSWSLYSISKPILRGWTHRTGTTRRRRFRSRPQMSSCTAAELFAGGRPREPGCACGRKTDAAALRARIAPLNADTRSTKQPTPLHRCPRAQANHRSCRRPPLPQVCGEAFGILAAAAGDSHQPGGNSYLCRASASGPLPKSSVLSCRSPKEIRYPPKACTAVAWATRLKC